MSEDLKALQPEGKTVQAAGESITLLPFTFGKYPAALKLMSPVVDALKTSGILTLADNSIRLAADWPLRVLDVVAQGGEPLLELCMFATGKPREWFDTLPGDEGIAIAMAIFEVNADFFRKRIAPSLGLSVKPDASTGSTSSTPSSAPDTTDPTSTATP